MARMTRPRLKRVKALDDFRLEMEFIDSRIREVDFKPLIKASPGLKPLANQAAFSQVSIGEDMGWTAEWPELDIQIGADTLLLDAEAQNAPDENTRIFLEWRAKNGLSLSDAARALGMTPRTMSAYGTGGRPVPRYIALACIGWETKCHRRVPHKAAHSEHARA
ncbi:MAG: DUF2442 domain-containing protein [Zoogloeaceae bacterium]|jgi:hypothetical protein|nr:DUF2442 domain-containing protein [Zoogloeaceae bacterium]